MLIELGKEHNELGKEHNGDDPAVQHSWVRLVGRAQWSKAAPGEASVSLSSWPPL